jgi:hypothetical protein
MQLFISSRPIVPLLFKNTYDTYVHCALWIGLSPYARPGITTMDVANVDAATRDTGCLYQRPCPLDVGRLNLCYHNLANLNPGHLA